MVHTLHRRWPSQYPGERWLAIITLFFYLWGQRGWNVPFLRPNSWQLMNTFLCYKSSSSASWNIAVILLLTSLVLLLLITADIWSTLSSFAGTVGWRPSIRCLHPLRTDNSFPWDIPLPQAHLPPAFQVCVLAGLTPPKHYHKHQFYCSSASHNNLLLFPCFSSWRRTTQGWEWGWAMISRRINREKGNSYQAMLT